MSWFGFEWGKCFLSPIPDMKTGETVSCDLSESANLEQIKRMLSAAFDKFEYLSGSDHAFGPGMAAQA